MFHRSAVNARRTGTFRNARRLTFASLAMLTLVAGACKDSTGKKEEDEPSVTSARLTFGNGTVVTLTGTGATPTARIPVGATTVTAQWLRADGTPDPVATTNTFRLEVTAPTGNIAFVRSGSNAFAGTLTATTATNTTIPVTFSLFHVAEGHSDFGPLTVNFTVGS